MSGQNAPAEQTLHVCGSMRDTPRSSRKPERGFDSRSPATHLTVNFHCHVLTLAAEPLVADRPQKQNEPALMLKSMGEASVAHNNAVMLPHTFPKLARVLRNASRT